MLRVSTESRYDTAGVQARAWFSALPAAMAVSSPLLTHRLGASSGGAASVSGVDSWRTSLASKGSVEACSGVGRTPWWIVSTGWPRGEPLTVRVARLRGGAPIRLAGSRVKPGMLASFGVLCSPCAAPAAALQPHGGLCVERVRL